MANASIPAKQYYEILRSQLRTERAAWESDWRDVDDYILPGRTRFVTTDVNRAIRRSTKIIDSSASFSARTLAAGMQSGITSPARPWFRLTTPNPELADNAAVKEWLHETTKRMESVFARSNVYDTLQLVYGDLGGFGTGCMVVLEDDQTVIRCIHLPVGSYFIAVDHRLEVKVFLREMRLSARQMVEEFASFDAKGEPIWGNLSVAVKNLWDLNNRDKPAIDVVHVVVPNDQWDPHRAGVRYKRFKSVYYERGATGTNSGTVPEDVGGPLLREEGFDEFPVMAPRWEAIGQDAYGKGCPGFVAMGDVKQLQLMEKRGAQALDKMVNPPMKADPDYLGTKLSTLPGDVSYVADKDGKGFAPVYQVQLQFEQLESKEDQVRQRIARAFFEDLFLMLEQLDRKEITATEIVERKEEKMLVLGPVLTRVNTDCLNPLIDRLFNVMARRQLLPQPIPAELQGQALQVEFISILHQAQQAAGIAGVERLTGFVSQLAEAKADPSVFDKLDLDAAIEEYAAMAGVPPKLIVAEDKVTEIRQQRAQQQAAQQQAEMAAKLAPAAQALSRAQAARPDLASQFAGVGAPGGLPA